MKVVITGGAGFIGSHIVDAFLAKGHEVLVIDDLSSGVREQVANPAKLLELDIRSKEAAQALSTFSPDLVVHAAAQMSVRNSMEDPPFDVDVNVKGIVNLLHGLGDKRPFFVFISTGGAIYGEQESFPATESHPKRPASIYGLSKHVSELYLEFWQRELGLKHGVLRLGNVYGPRQNPHGEAGVIAIFAKLLLAGKTPTINGTGEQTRDFIYVADVVRAVVALAESKKTGVYNVGTAKETSVNTVYKTMVNYLGKDLPPIYGPSKEGEQLRSCIDPSAAASSFGWKPAVDLNQGLAETLDWFKSKYSR